MNTFPKAQMPPAPEAPKHLAPKGACDGHVHLVAGPEDFPLWDNRVEDPAPGPNFDQWLDLYRAHLNALGCTRGVVVHSILYGSDNSVTLEALRRLGDGFKGVGLLPDGATAAQIEALADANISAVRLNYVHGGILTWQGAQEMSNMLADRGMHIQMLINAHKHIEDLSETIMGSPVPIVIDHLGWPELEAGVGEPGFQRMCQLLADGHIWVKLSGAYRLCDAPYDVADPFVSALVAANPDQCLWGSDWPHLMLANAKMPSAARLLDAFHRVVTDDANRQKILVANPQNLYSF